MNSAEFLAYIASDKKKRQSRERKLQTACVTWFRFQFPKFRYLLFSIPNGAQLYGNKTERAKQWRALEAEGATPGAADLFLSIPSGDFPGLYIEMKTPKGTQSAKQKAFEQAVIEQGYGYAIPRTFEAFQKTILSYLNGVY